MNDFLFIENTKQSALNKFKTFLDVCADLGIPLAADKTVLPTQVMEFVGITIDVRQKETQLPRDKVGKCQNLLYQYQNKKACTLKEIQSLVGVLNVACSVILPGDYSVIQTIYSVDNASFRESEICINKQGMQ